MSVRMRRISNAGHTKLQAVDEIGNRETGYDDSSRQQRMSQRCGFIMCTMIIIGLFIVFLFFNPFPVSRRDNSRSILLLPK